MNDILNIFETMDENEELNLKTDPLVKYGFIVSPKYNNKTILLPNNASDHSTTIKFVLGKLFKTEKQKYYNLYKEVAAKNLNNLDDGYHFTMDENEFSMSLFLASLGNLVFLNLSTQFYTSGILLIPEGTNSKEIESKKNECLYNIQKDDPDYSVILYVPSLIETLENNKQFEKIEDENSYQKK